MNNETMTLPKDQTVRTEDAGHSLHMRLKRTSDEIEEYLATNLNKASKRYRNTAENSIDLGKQENFMRKIRVTHVGCSDLSQPVTKPPSETCLAQETLSILGAEPATPVRPNDVLDSRSNDGNFTKCKILLDG